MNAPLHFKQQLAAELDARATTLAASAGRPARVRAVRRRPVLALGAVAAAVAAAVAVPLAGGSAGGEVPGGPSARPAPHRTGSAGLDIVTADYVVKTLPGDTIAVEVMSPRGIPGLQAALREAGIPAVVTTFSASCRATVLYDPRADSTKVFPRDGAGAATDGRLSLIRPDAVPEGDHLLFVATTGRHGRIGTLQMSVVREVPACVPESDNGIGAGYVAPGTRP
ncbi:hypothetical protein ACGF1Z_30670 [Streptomyces sp. NPDC048018]|uniref:hypothetical protein n=1 Tax=Streptomyces sp. NPDC048018 TaxID=3365499 RepID=UPI003716C5CD